MKKIGIISDTHGLLRPEILEILKGCDCIIHAGDVNKPEILDKLRVMGNMERLNCLRKIKHRMMKL